MVAPWRLVTFVAAIALAASGCGAVDTGIFQGSGTESGANASHDQTAAVPTIVIMDSSGSMAIDDAPGPRIDAARAAVGRLVESLPDNATLGLVTYGSQTTEDQGPDSCTDVTTPLPPASLDRAAASRAVSELSPGGWTPIGTALEHSVELLPGQGPAQIVLVSDGEANCDPPPCEVAERLAGQNPDLRISTIGFRTTAEQLDCVARVGRGVYVTADNAAQLDARLRAVQDGDSATSTMTGRMMHGIEVGARLDAVRHAFDDFPTGGDSRDGAEVYLWRDCEWWFADGVLTQVSPLGDGRTIDGVGPGSTVGELQRFYGRPLAWREGPDDVLTVDFLADPALQVVWRAETTGRDPTATVRRISMAAAPTRPALMELVAPDGRRQSYGNDFREVAPPPRFDRVQVFPRATGLATPNSHGQWDDDLLACWRRSESTALCIRSVASGEVFEVPARYASVTTDESPEASIILAAVLEDGTVCDVLPYAHVSRDLSGQVASGFHCPDGERLWGEAVTGIPEDHSPLKGPDARDATPVPVTGYVVALDTDAR